MRLPSRSHLHFPQNHAAAPGLYYSKLWGPFYRCKLKLLCDYLPQERVVNLLEVGFGAGIALKELAHHSQNVTAIDVHEHISAVERMLKEEKIFNVRLIKHDIFGAPFPFPYLFDYVLSSSVFEHIAPPLLENGLRNISHIIPPGGYLLLGFPLKNPIMNTAFAIYQKVYRWFKPSMFSFSLEHDHPSSQHEIMPLVEKYFFLEEKKYFLNDKIPLYVVLKCLKK